MHYAYSEVILVMLAVVNAQAVEVSTMLGELALGVVLGVVVPWVAIRLERSRFFAATSIYEPLNAFAIGLLVLALASLTHANQFLAAFSAGVIVATLSLEVRDAFHEFGEILTELLKLAALLVFGVLISPNFLAEIPPSGYAFALLALLVVRPIALGVALLGSGLDWREQVAAAWFGPKGFASVVYGMLILKAGIARGDELFHLLAIVIAGSIIAHSSTDVIVAHWFQRPEAELAELPASRHG